MASFTQRSGKWHVRIRVVGQPTRSATFPTKRAAQAWAREQEAKSDPAASVAMTLSGALERYAQEITPTKRGAERERNRVAALARTPIGTRCLTSIHGRDVAKYRDIRLADVSPSTVQKELALISHVFTIARKEWGLPVSNPVLEVRKPRAAEGRRFRLKPEVEQRILEATSNVEFRNFLILLVETAARRGELLSVRWADVDLECRTLWLQCTKNGFGRTIPLSRRACEAFSQIPHLRGGQVFSLKPDYVSHAFKQLAIKAGVPHLRLHDLRHEAISRFLEKGLSIAAVQSISGHKTVQMLARYSHVVVPPEWLD